MMVRTMPMINVTEKIITPAKRMFSIMIFILTVQHFISPDTG